MERVRFSFGSFDSFGLLAQVDCFRVVAILSLGLPGFAAAADEDRRAGLIKHAPLLLADVGGEPSDKGGSSGRWHGGLPPCWYPTG